MSHDTHADAGPQALGDIGVEPDEPPTRFLMILGLSLTVAVFVTVVGAVKYFQWATAIELKEKGYDVESSAPGWNSP